jgi:hypothetical protein
VSLGSRIRSADASQTETAQQWLNSMAPASVDTEFLIEFAISANQISRMTQLIRGVIGHFLIKSI